MVPIRRTLIPNRSLSMSSSGSTPSSTKLIGLIWIPTNLSSRLAVVISSPYADFRSSFPETRRSRARHPRGKTPEQNRNRPAPARTRGERAPVLLGHDHVRFARIVRPAQTVPGISAAIVSIVSRIVECVPFPGGRAGRAVPRGRAPSSLPERHHPHGSSRAPPPAPSPRSAPAPRQRDRVVDARHRRAAARRPLVRPVDEPETH